MYKLQPLESDAVLLLVSSSVIVELVVEPELTICTMPPDDQIYIYIETRGVKGGCTNPISIFRIFALF